MTELALRFIDVVDTTRLVERLGDARAARNEAQTVVVALGAGPDSDLGRECAKLRLTLDIAANAMACDAMQIRI